MVDRIEHRTRDGGLSSEGCSLNSLISPLVLSRGVYSYLLEAIRESRDATEFCRPCVYCVSLEKKEVDARDDL